MSTIFLTILSRSLWLSGVIVFLFLLRTCFRRIPGRAFYFLWLIVFLGLICPVSLKIPHEATVPHVSVPDSGRGCPVSRGHSSCRCLNGHRRANYGIRTCSHPVSL